MAIRTRRQSNHRIASSLLGLLAMSLALTTIRCCTFTQPQTVPSEAKTATSRRDLLLRTSGLVAAPMIASATLFGDAAEAGAAKWSGKYEDPKHPGCERRISKDNLSGEYTIAGATNRDKTQKGCDADPKSVKRWALTGRPSSDDTMLVDFSPKGGPKDVEVKLVKTLKSEGIAFPDGNTWRKLKNKPGTTGITDNEFDTGR